MDIRSSGTLGTSTNCGGPPGGKGGHSPQKRDESGPYTWKRDYHTAILQCCQYRLFLTLGRVVIIGSEENAKIRTGIISSFSVVLPKTIGPTDQHKSCVQRNLALPDPTYTRR